MPSRPWASQYADATTSLPWDSRAADSSLADVSKQDYRVDPGGTELELPPGLTVAELTGGFARPDVRPLASRIEQSCLRRLQALPGETQ
jgi:hypothetical protein